MPKPTVVIVSDHGSVVGGAEKVAFGSAVGLLERRYDVHALIGTGEIEPSLREQGLKGESAHFDTYWSEWFKLGKVGMFRNLLSNGRPEAWARTQLAKFDPATTVLHFHVFYSFLTNAVLDVAIQMGFRCFVTCHDYNLVCPSSTFFHTGTGKPCGQKALSAGCFKCDCFGPNSGYIKTLRFARTWRLHKLSSALSKVERFLFVSEKSGQILRPYLPSGAKGQVLLNPVEFDPEFVPASIADRPLFLWLGRMVQEKGPRIAAEAGRLAGVKITFGGEGGQLESIRNEYPEHEYLGWVNGNRVQELYAQSKATLMTSQWYETASLVTLDSMAKGVAPIVADVTVATDWFDEGVSGRSFRYDDPVALAKVLEDFKDDAYAERLGRAAREKFMVDPPTMEKHLDQLEALYRE